MPLFGSHLSIAGGHHLAVHAAAELGFDSVQVFTKSASQWYAKPLTPDDLDRFHAAIRETGIQHPVAHTSYLLNLASPKRELWAQSVDSLVVEIQRAEALGIHDLVLHPGAHMGEGEERGLTEILHGLDEVIRRTPGSPVIIDLESTAGQGTTLGWRLDHLGWLLAHAKCPQRLGICLDTCHLLAAGYRLDTPDLYNDFMETLARQFPPDRIRVWHLNDSAKPLGSRVDRHAHLGAGHVGLQAFQLIVTDPRFQHCPMILETPKGVGTNHVPWDTINLNILRTFLPQSPPKSAPEAHTRDIPTHAKIPAKSQPKPKPPTQSQTTPAPKPKPRGHAQTPRATPTRSAPPARDAQKGRKP